MKRKNAFALSSLAPLKKIILTYLEGFLLVLSPLLVLLFIVGVIALLDRGGSHLRFVQKMNAGLVTSATIRFLASSGDPAFFVDFVDAAQEERVGVLKTVYYPVEVVQGLKPGDTITIRYLEPGYESEVVLDAAYPYVQNYLGFAIEPGLILLGCWILIVIRPDFLFWGFNSEFGSTPRGEKHV